jgi:hypothetical protein
MTRLLDVRSIWTTLRGQSLILLLNKNQGTYDFRAKRLSSIIAEIMDVHTIAWRVTIARRARELKVTARVIQFASAIWRQAHVVLAASGADPNPNYRKVKKVKTPRISIWPPRDLQVLKSQETQL